MNLVFLENKVFTFYGEDTATIDEGGRFKLSAAFCRELRRGGNIEVILFGLPEGGIGVYPPATWEQLQDQLITPAKKSIGSIAARRTLRLYCSQSQITSLSRQGRLSIPRNLRDHAGIVAGSSIVQVGIGLGIEVWATDRWSLELSEIKEHIMAKGERQMHADLAQEGNGHGHEA